jgi:hypothetical protein
VMYPYRTGGLSRCSRSLLSLKNGLPLCLPPLG